MPEKIIEKENSSNSKSFNNNENDLFDIENEFFKKNFY